MTEGLNKVLLLGNLGADPELRVTQGGQAVLKLRLATSESYVDRNEQRQERTEWHSVVMWGKRGEALAKLLKKGERIFVEGSLRTTSYEKDGTKLYRTEINATNIILNGRGEKEQHEERGASPPPRRETRAAPPRQQEIDPYDDYPGDDGEPPF